MISEVLGRSFLVTAILSFGLTPAVLILSAKAAATVGSAGDGAAALGGLIGGGLVSSVGIGISLFFTVLSLIAYALVKLYVKEGSNKTARLVPCAMCSEPIQRTAKKCRFCGEMV